MRELSLLYCFKDTCIISQKSNGNIFENYQTDNKGKLPLGAIGCREEILNITTCTILQRKKLQVTHWICIKYTYYTMCWMRFGMTMFCREWASQWEKILWLGKIVTWTICYTNWQILRTWSPAKIFPWTSVGSLCVTKPQQRERFVLTMNPYVILFVYYYNCKVPDRCFFVKLFV